ncbi:Uncharacterised protein [Burkholderia oklahomensis]|nr:hypothetical protein BG90_4710 [Burkholderia oklahomensis C6786]SUY27513.1 Uncharacterised protein [Burkholderia oklahomensis]
MRDRARHSAARSRRALSSPPRVRIPMRVPAGCSTRNLKMDRHAIASARPTPSRRTRASPVYMRLLRPFVRPSTTPRSHRSATLPSPWAARLLVRASHCKRIGIPDIPARRRALRDIASSPHRSSFAGNRQTYVSPHSGDARSAATATAPRARSQPHAARHTRTRTRRAPHTSHREPRAARRAQTKKSPRAFARGDFFGLSQLPDDSGKPHAVLTLPRPSASSARGPSRARWPASPGTSALRP